MVRLILLFVLLVATPAWAGTALRVVTTLPDLADWVRQIGGVRVEVVSLLHGTEDPHTYESQVSDVKALAGARVLVEVGLGLEEWVSGLVENARNSQLLVVEAGDGLALEQPGEGQVDGAHHPRGNPHVWLDPANAARMCARIAATLEVADPPGGAFYQQNLKAYQERLAAAAAAIRERVQRLDDRRFISYHPAWPYFARALGFEVAAVVTSIPGQEPSARRVAELVKQVRGQNLRVLVTEPQLPSEIPDLLAEETGIAVVTLSPIVGSGPAQDYLGQLQANADTLLRALGAPLR
ncbi:MAG: metal ABC transporter substrate-binding protein [Deferrisomatales bacterium]|nr:metal ABC transporter substrate-binding protein [Deferrisomatales bacterium]